MMSITIRDAYGYSQYVSATNPLPVTSTSSSTMTPVDQQSIYRAQVSSTTTVLDISATYTGPSINGIQFRRLTGRVYADQGGTLYIEHSHDATTWDRITTITVAANDRKGFDEPFYLQYARVVYVNGSLAQTAFRLHTYLSVV